MTHKVKSVEYGDTVSLDNGDKYRAVDGEGRSAIFSIQVGDIVEIRGLASEATMKAFGNKEFKVRRV